MTASLSITKAEAARRLGVTQPSVAYHIRRGNLDAKGKGRGERITVASVERLSRVRAALAAARRVK